MKLAAIYNVWDGIEIFEASLNSIISNIDIVIIIYQSVSNYGELFDPLLEIMLATNNFPDKEIIVKNYNPIIGHGALNETAKRNLGISIACECEATHFLNMDTDECYKDFGEAKQQYIDSGKEGSVCKLYTYFKKPTLRFDTEDGYFVPFIHKLNLNTVAGNVTYPFYVDPTRRINCENVVLIESHMHHFSWVRKDIERKCRNSSAKINIERGTMLTDYYNSSVALGFYVKDYDKTLIEVDNFFNIEV